jgi:hypothetical protein
MSCKKEFKTNSKQTQKEEEIVDPEMEEIAREQEEYLRILHHVRAWQRREKFGFQAFHPNVVGQHQLDTTKQLVKCNQCERVDLMIPWNVYDPTAICCSFTDVDISLPLSRDKIFSWCHGCGQIAYCSAKCRSKDVYHRHVCSPPSSSDIKHFLKRVSQKQHSLTLLHTKL